MNHNMKKRGLALLLACCCVFTAAPVAVKADNVSISTNQTPTGTYSSYTKAEVLKSDTVVYDTLSTSNNVHFYKYTAEKAGYFTVGRTDQLLRCRAYCVAQALPSGIRKCVYSDFP